MSWNLGDILVTVKGKSEGFQQVLSTVKSAGEAVQSVTDKIGKAGDKSIAAGKTMSVALTAPIVGFGVAAFKSSADFEKTMNQVAAATGEPKESMKELSELALKMGADTAYSSAEAADAMLELSKGGLTAAQIKAGGLAATMTLAAAGGIELSTAAGYVSNSLNTFGLGADQANAAAAALAGGANASTASVDSLGQALSQVGPGAKLAGYSLQDTVAVLAAFDNAGVKGSDAGTSLKTMLMNLTPQTKEAGDQMKALGLKFTDAKGNFIPIRDVAQQLQDKLKGLTTEQKQNALQTMFGTDAYRAAAILMNEGSAGVDKYAAATNDLGAAQKMADSNMAGSAGAVQKMMGSIETAIQKAGDVIAPTIVKVMDKVGEWADKFGKLTPEAQQVIIIVMALVAALGPLLIGLGMLAKGIETIGIVTAALAKNPAIIAWTLAILAVAALAYLIISNWDQVKRWFADFWSWLQSAAGNVGKWFSEAWTIVLNGVKSLFDFIKGKFDQFIGWVETNKQAIINWAIIIGTFLLPMFTKLAINAAVAAAKAVWAAVVSGAAWVKSAVLSAAAWAKTLPGIIANNARAAGSAAIESAKAGGSWIKQAVLTGVSWAKSFGLFMAGMAKMVGQFLLQAARMALGWLLAMGPIGLIIAVVVGLVALIIANWETVKGWFAAFWKWLGDVANATWDWIMQKIRIFVLALMIIFDAIGKFFSAVWENIKNAAIAVWVAITNFIWLVIQGWMNVFQAIGTFLAMVWQGVINGVVAAWNWITDVIIRVIDGWRGIFQAIGTFLINVFNNAVNGVKSVWGTITSWFTGLVTGIGNTFNNIAGMISGPFKTAFNAVAGFWNNSIGQLKWKAPDWVPGIGGKEIGAPKLPMLRDGGIATRATMAIVGEGPEDEAIVPLSKLGQVADQVGGGGGTHNEFHFQGIMARSSTELRDVFEEALTLVDQRRKAQGKKPILG